MQPNHGTVLIVDGPHTGAQVPRHRGGVFTMMDPPPEIEWNPNDTEFMDKPVTATTYTTYMIRWGKDTTRTGYVALPSVSLRKPASANEDYAREMGWLEC